MRPGPPPKPLEQKRRTGNPGQRPLPSLRDTFALERIPTEPPEELDVAGQMLWVHIASLPWVSTSDAAALVTMCRLADRVADLERELVEHGYTYETRGRRYPNPALAAITEAEKRLWASMAAFGLTPADRTRLGIAEIKAESKFDELMSRKQRASA